MFPKKQFINLVQSIAYFTRISSKFSFSGGVSRLEISSLRDSDAGEYVCQLSLLTGLLSVQHTLDVLGTDHKLQLKSFGYYQSRLQ